jgi:hypothetical protein
MENQQQIELSKYFTSVVSEVRRSEINPATYNPRFIDEDGKKLLKRSLKKYGVLGGIIVNKRTGNTVVGGHQKIYILDEVNKYPDNDYKLRVEFIDVDERTEKTINVVLNNPNVGGQWDYDKLAELIPDINYKDAGLTDADLEMVGLGYLLRTEEQNDILGELNDIHAPLAEEAEARRLARKAAREAEQDADASEDDTADTEDVENAEDNDIVFEMPTEEEVRQAKIDHMKAVKQQVKEQAQEQAQNMDAYLVLSFDDFKAKSYFCQRFGYDPYTKFIKGELFDEQVERVMD